MLLVAAGVLWSDWAYAQAYENARLHAFGGARRALGGSTDALFINPAGLSATPTYELEFGYADDFRGSDRRVSVAVADGQAGPVAGGLAFTYGLFRPPGEDEGARRFEGFRIDVAAAVPIAGGFSLGSGLRFVNYELREGDVEIEDGGTTSFTFDVGLRWQIEEYLSIAATVVNIVGEEHPGVPRAWGAGVGYRSGPFSVEVDIDHAWESTDPVYTASLGYILGQRFPLRGAVAFRQETEEVELSVGAGVAVERIGFDLGYRQILNRQEPLRDADERLFVATFRVRVF